MKTTIINNPPKSWWEGDERVEEFMPPVREVLDSMNIILNQDLRTRIYNRAYEAVYNAVIKYDKVKE